MKMLSLIALLCLPFTTASLMSKEATPAQNETATLAAGCFWCIEAVMERVEGVQSVVSGYTGGNVENPSYRAVTSGKTGHAEAARIAYDPSKISYSELLEIFWQMHDPTTLNRQGADVGTQYRSAIYYHNEEQKQQALASKRRAAKDFKDPIVTEISKASIFYEAETYHQDYYNLNPNAGYCRYVIHPKLKKLGME